MKTLKILHLLSQRPDATGSGIYVQAMIREAAARGYENYLVAGLASDACEGTDCIAPDRFLSVNFNTPDVATPDVAYRIPGMSDNMPYDSSRFCDLNPSDLDAYEAAFTTRIQAAVKSFSPDIIHSHHLWVVSALARRLFPSIPMVTTCHGTDLRQFQNCPHIQPRVLADCRNIDTVMALSAAQKQDICGLYDLSPEKVVVVGAGYDDQLFYAVSKPLAGPVQVLYAGKLCFAKGVPWLLRVLQDLAADADLPGWQLHLVGGGSGEEKAHCRELAGALGDRVRVHGKVDQQVLAERMRQSHILVLPSFFEGLPLVLLEALACGCRLVATDLPGTKELFGQVAADPAAPVFLVKTPRLRSVDQPYPEDEAAFRRDLGRALKYQMRAAAKGEAPDLFSVRDMLDAYTWKGIFKKVQEIYQTQMTKKTV